MNIRARQNNPLLSGLNRMIKEEDFISQRQTNSIFNQHLIEKLKAFKELYEQQLHNTYSDKEPEILSYIYKLIISLNSIPMVKIQLDAIKTYRQYFLSSNEQVTDKQMTHL